jgi:arsenate reductase
VIQIIGTRKDRETAKAIRACKEHGFGYHFVDLDERSLSAGEWNAIFMVYPPATLIDIDCTYYKKAGYSWRDFDAQEELIEHPQLLILPILRSKGRVHKGFDLEILLEWGRA